MFRQNDGYKGVLAWLVCPKLKGQTVEMLQGYVDAVNGKVYSFIDTVDYFEAKGNVYPKHNDDLTDPDGKLQDDW